MSISSPASAKLQSYEDADPQASGQMYGLHGFTRPGAPTTLKRRFVDPSYMRKLFEVYFMNDEPMTAERAAKIDRTIAEIAPECRCRHRNRFRPWPVGPSSIDAADARSRFLAVNCQSTAPIWATI